MLLLGLLQKTWKPVALMGAGYAASEFDLVTKLFGLF